MINIIVYTILYILLAFLCGLFFRMGGSAKYNKLWRRIGSASCMLVGIMLIVGFNNFLHIVSAGLLFWGCVSYMGWLNYVIRGFAIIDNMKREYIWNFFFENLVLQSSVLPYKHSIFNIMLVIFSALLIAFIKVEVDKDKDGKILCWRKDVLSEFLHGSLNFVGIVINLIFIS